MGQTTYSHPLGSGNRTSLIAVTATAGLLSNSGADPMKFVNGTMANESYFAQPVLNGTYFLTFDFKVPTRIDEATMYQNAAYSHGNWQWQASNDGITYVDIGATFILGGAVKAIMTTLSSNVNEYRYYRMKGVSGTPNTSPYIHEFEFKVYEPYNKFLISSGSDILRYYKNPLVNTVPKMTSNTAPSGIVETSGVFNTSGDFDGWNAFNRSPNGYGWYANAAVGWISYQFTSPKNITSYSILMGYGMTGAYGFAPKNWTFEAWDTHTLSWIVLETRTNELGWVSLEKRTYSFSNVKSYTKFRLNVTATQAGQSIAIDEIELFEPLVTDVTYIPEIDEKYFINYGMDEQTVVELGSACQFKNYVNQTSSTLGSGKVFKQTIDTSKIAINKASIQ